MSTGVASALNLAFGRFELSISERRLRAAGSPVGLGSRAFDLLAVLVGARNRIVDKAELIDKVWPGLVVEENNLQVQISALRKVLGAQAIATVPGRGYQFTMEVAAPLEEVAAVGPASSQVLPRMSALRAQADPAAQVGGGPFDTVRRGARLLVADDNKVNRLMLSRTLQLLGHEVASADNGRKALERLRNEGFDLLLLDLKMPMMDGFDLLECRAIEPAMQGVPVIITSSVEGVADMARCIELGADDFLHKPVNPVLLRARVDASLERKFLRDRQRALLARLGPDVVDSPEVYPGARCEEATVLVALFADVATGALADDVARPAPQRVQEILEPLSAWIGLMHDAVETLGGRVQQIRGNGLTAVFGLPRLSAEDSCPAWACLQAAREMAEIGAQFDSERPTERLAHGPPAMGIAIGIASGDVIAGYVGTPRRQAHVCIGVAVQRASRLAERAHTLGRPVLFDRATLAAVKDITNPTINPLQLPADTGAESVFALILP